MRFEAHSLGGVPDPHVDPAWCREIHGRMVLEVNLDGSEHHGLFAEDPPFDPPVHVRGTVPLVLTHLLNIEHMFDLLGWIKHCGCLTQSLRTCETAAVRRHVRQLRAACRSPGERSRHCPPTSSS